VIAMDPDEISGEERLQRSHRTSEVGEKLENERTRIGAVRMDVVMANAVTESVRTGKLVTDTKTEVAETEDTETEGADTEHA